MILKEYQDFVIAHQHGIEFDEYCIGNCIAAMDRFNLDSCCPIDPNYHRKFGIFECNMIYPYRTIGVEFHGRCIIFRKPVWEKILKLDFHFIQIRFIELKLNHALVCNAMMYAI